MTHTFSLTCALSAAIALIIARKTEKKYWICLSGISVGILSLIRPLEGVTIAGLLGLWAIGVGGRRMKLSSIILFIITVIIGCSAVFPYNKLLTGNSTVFPIMAYAESLYGPNANALGFGPDKGVGFGGLDPLPGHALVDVLINANFNMFSLNIELFGWCTGSLILIMVLLLSKRKHKSDYLMLAVIVSVIGIHSLYWFSGGPDFGARYWFLIIIPCIAIGCQGHPIFRK